MIEKGLELLKKLLTQHEWNWYVEFKENFDKMRDWKNISAISNIVLLKWRDFWYIVYWIKDNTKEIIWTDFNPNNFRVWNQNLHIWLSQKLSPKPFLDFIELEKEWKKWYTVWFEGLIDYIISKIWENEEIWRALRVKKSIYPEVSIREFIANAIIHQDFSITWAWPIIEIYKNRIEITNPWIPLIDIDRFMDHPPKSRNEDLASLMRRFWYCEESGSWVDRAIFNIELFQMPAPKFEIFDEFTRVTLYTPRELRFMSESDRIRSCYQHCVLKYVSWEEKMTNSSLRQRFNIEEKNYSMASRIIKLTLKDWKIKLWERKNEYIPYWA